MDRYTYTYDCKGGRWAFELYAESFEDTEGRLQSLKSTGKLDGLIREQGTVDLSEMDRFLDDMKRECGMDDQR